ncbi:MAG: aldo/keto reductase [Actinobacteria bacterium]|nr:MAG: aldo/keto reductase [Actinomycetota bacterium]
MIYRDLGRTGERVSLIGLGGFHIGEKPTREEGVGLIREAIDRGVTFMDNSWDYNDGESDRRFKDALQGIYRDQVLLMTKVDGRTKKAVRQQLDESLLRMGVDHIDLLQLHEIIRWDDPDRAYAPGGAVEGFDEARRGGKIRFTGFTGHKEPKMFLEMLESDYAWDTVQMPLNVLDAHHNSFEKQVLPVLVERGIGVLGMKPLCAGKLFESGADVTAAEGLHYAMNLATDVVITGIQSRQDLQQALEAAETFHPMDEDEVRELLSRTAEVAAGGRFEEYKTTDRHDGTERNPQWLVAA